MKKLIILTPLIIAAPVLIAILVAGKLGMKYGISSHEMWE
jgi:hypothetical protein